VISVHMTDGFATAVSVSIPIFALAAGAEARTVRERLKRPDKAWEGEFARYSAERELDPGGSAAEVFAYFRDMPKLSRLHTAERVLAIASAVAWLVVFALLTVAELLSLVWLADGDPAGHSALAVFALVSIGLAMVTLIVAPTLYLAVPLLLPLDLVPAKLTKAVLPKAASERGRGFLRQLAAELEGAIDRAADKADHADEAAKAERPAAAADADAR
jgi:fumarate reductase subunit D